MSALINATTPAGMNLPVVKNRLYMTAVRLAEVSRDANVAGLHNLPCTRHRTYLEHMHGGRIGLPLGANTIVI